MPGKYLDCGCFSSSQGHLTRCPAHNAQVELDMAQESLNASLPQLTSIQNDIPAANPNPPSFQELAQQWHTTWEGHWQSIKDRDFPQLLLSVAADATTLSNTPDYGPNTLRLQGRTADVIISPSPRNWAFVEEVLPKGSNTTNDFWRQLEGLLGP